MQNRLIIASNRLPFSLRKKNRKLELKQSSGGLVSAIKSIPKENEIIWIGAADFKEELWNELDKDQLDYKLIPLFLDKKTEDLYYNGFSNGMLWPLCHYFPSFAEYNASYFKAYSLVNQHFAETIRKVARPDDIVWVQDYQLMLVPGFLRNSAKPVRSSYFLHIPFPSYEIVKLIPEEWRTELLNSLLSCDVLGFQTAEYASHFKRSLSYFMGIEGVNNTVSVNGHITTIKDYPISIDFDKFNLAFDHPSIVKGRQQILQKHRGMKIIFSLDRLDYSKGVINRLEAFEQMLAENQGLKEKVVFVINVIPSREKIDRYAERKKMIEENISRINGLYGSIQWQPIIYQYQHLSFHQLIACYTACDIALVTPLRDGMNLVAKEFVATRKDLRGCLILSEFAGAAHELKDAILVNPHDVHLMHAAMIKAINMGEKAQEKAMEVMREAVRKNDINTWLNNFLADTTKSMEGINNSHQNVMSFYDKLEIFDAYREARRRLILLDYDGTLVNFCNDPKEAQPGNVLRDLLKKFTSNENNKVMLISGRDSETLQRWFKNTTIDLVAEHGILHRHSGDEGWTHPAHEGMAWKENVRDILNKYVVENPGTFIEEKIYSLAWHYRAARMMKEEEVRLHLSKELMQMNLHGEFEILHGKKVVEIKSSRMNKGKFVGGLLEEEEFDFVLAIGDDTTDEDMFNVLRESHHFTVKVGLGNTHARFNVIGVNNVLSFLDQLGDIKESLIRQPEA